MQPPSYKVFKIRQLVHDGRFVNEDNCYLLFNCIYIFGYEIWTYGINDAEYFTKNREHIFQDGHVY